VAARPRRARAQARRVARARPSPRGGGDRAARARVGAGRLAEARLSRRASSDGLFARALAGDRAALARALSHVENEAHGAAAILDASFKRIGRAFRIGVTGPPGAGKSTLVARIARELRARGESVAIVAVDPTSPFTGGALLGDRVRMGELAGDPKIFIRSMATRGGMGGLAVHTAQVCDVLDAAGFGRVLIETVGVGQSELEVAQTADSTVVVLVPESGDGVQAMKAGLMEIGDLFVINKADREGAERAAFAIRSALELRTSANDWTAPVLLTVASRGDGVSDLVDALQEHYEHLARRGELEQRRRRRLEQRLRDLVGDHLWQSFRARVSREQWERSVDDLAAHRLTPHEAARDLSRSVPASPARSGA
jgi:GTPase